MAGYCISGRARGRRRIGLAATTGHAVSTLLSGDRSAGAPVGPQVNEADLAQRCFAHDVYGAAELLAVHRRLLHLLDELELLDARPHRGLPGEAVPRGRDDFAGRCRVAGDHAGGDQLPALDLDRVSVTDAGGGVVREPDRAVLRRYG